MLFQIAGLMVSMNPKYEPLKTQAIPYLIEYQSSFVDCSIPQGEEVIKRYQNKHPELTTGESEYLLYGAYFYDSLLDHQGIFLHASCIVYENKAYLFSAPCGTGKSTHTQIWMKVFKNSFILNDDKPALRCEDNQIVAYGTPFSGKTNQNKNEKYLIEGIAFIKRNSENKITRLEANKAIPLLFSQTMPPYHVGRLNQMTKMVELIIKQIPIYELNCNMEDEAALVAYQGMKRETYE